MADPLRPELRTTVRRKRIMHRTAEERVQAEDRETQARAQVPDLRARLLKMIVENEAARKPKSP